MSSNSHSTSTVMAFVRGYGIGSSLWKTSPPPVALRYPIIRAGALHRIGARVYGCRRERRCELISQLESESDFAHMTDAQNEASNAPNLDHPSPIDDDDRKKVDEITSESSQVLDDVADEVRADVQQLLTSSQQMADDMIEEETKALMEKYEMEQKQLLQNVDSERRIIREEVQRIESMSGASNSTWTASSMPSGKRLLLTTALLFALASLAYLWTAVANTDSVSLRNAGVDMVVAVVAVYYSSRRPPQT